MDCGLSVPADSFRRRGAYPVIHSADEMRALKEAPGKRHYVLNHWAYGADRWITWSDKELEALVRWSPPSRPDIIGGAPAE